MWDAPPIRLDPSTADLRFLNFFNWDQIGLLDSRLIQVLIERFSDQPQFEGRFGLLEVEDCTIWWNTNPLFFRAGTKPNKYTAWVWCSFYLPVQLLKYFLQIIQPHPLL